MLGLATRGKLSDGATPFCNPQLETWSMFPDDVPLCCATYILPTSVRWMFMWLKANVHDSFFQNQDFCAGNERFSLFLPTLTLRQRTFTGNSAQVALEVGHYLHHKVCLWDPRLSLWFGCNFYFKLSLLLVTHVTCSSFAFVFFLEPLRLA